MKCLVSKKNNTYYFVSYFSVRIHKHFALHMAYKVTGKNKTNTAVHIGI